MSTVQCNIVVRLIFPDKHLDEKLANGINFLKFFHVDDKNSIADPSAELEITDKFHFQWGSH